MDCALISFLGCIRKGLKSNDLCRHRLIKTAGKLNYKSEILNCPKEISTFARMKFRGMKNVLVLLVLLLCTSNLIAQKEYPYVEYDYPYIRYEQNKLIFPGDSTAFEVFFSKMDTLILRGKGKLNIIHFGGSHIQAGIYSGRTRERLQTFFPGMNGGRGLVFPYRMARSNGPNNYNITWTGSWTCCRNVQYRRNCMLGLLGISAETNSADASLEIVTGKKYLDYETNKIRVFYKMDSASFDIKLKNELPGVKYSKFPDRGYCLIESPEYLDTVQLQIKQTDSAQKRFRLYGVALENDDSGIVYHDSGINGASIPSYLRCELLETQMAQIKPDLVIISLGTNDTYTRNFKPDYYRENYIKLIKRIRNAAPKTAILMTVPNDSYYRRRYPNKNTAEAEKVILETAKKYNCGVWNFYRIMGGYNSSYLWHKDNLMAYDRIHFSSAGYLIKGDLLFNALLKAYDLHIDSKKYCEIPE